MIMSQREYRQNKIPLSHRICEVLELPEDVVRGCGYIELVSNCSVLVDGCKSVMEYDDSIVKLDLGKMRVKFTGSGLTIKSLSLSQAMIEGTVISLEFCE